MTTNDKLFSLEQLVGAIIKTEVSTLGSDKSFAMRLVKQLADTMRENERLKNELADVYANQSNKHPEYWFDQHGARHPTQNPVCPQCGGTEIGAVVSFRDSYKQCMKCDYEFDKTD